MATDNQPSYQDRIVQDPEILVGKPVVKGTRISVELVLAHLAANPDLGDLFASFPRLTIEDVQAILAYARHAVSQQSTPGSPWLRDLYEYFAPVREEAVAKGYSEQQINDAIDHAITAVRAEHA